MSKQDNIVLMTVICEECHTTHKLILENDQLPRFCPRCSYKLDISKINLHYFNKTTTIHSILKFLKQPNFRNLALRVSEKEIGG